MPARVASNLAAITRLAALLVLATMLASALGACASEEEQAVDTPSPGPAITEDTLSPEATPDQSPPPTSPAGFKPWEAPELTPELAAAGVRPFSVVIPSDFVEPPGVPFASPMTFISKDAPPAVFPYSPVPQLTVIVAKDQPEFPHPFIFHVGHQGGSGCTGDVSSRSATASQQVSSGAYVWDTYAFRCTQTQISYPPGPSYDGRVAETHTGNTSIAVVVFEPVGSPNTNAILQRAIETFTFK